MKIIRLSFLVLTIFASSFMVMAQVDSEKNEIETTDIQSLIGEWTGTLTYIDYNSGNPYSMPCELEIESKRTNRKLILDYTYPNEPKANSKSTIKISKDRKILDGKSIISNSETVDGDTQIITEFSGKDGNDRKQALIRNVYVIGADKFVVRKEVQFKDSKEWIKRNEYNFTRK